MTRAAMFIGTVAVAAMSYCWGYWTGRKDANASPRTEWLTRVDTLTVRDTITETSPVYRALRTRDTVRLAVRDTVRVTDTLFVMLPKEVRTYEGEGYRAVVSGVMPSLDTISVYGQTRYVTRTVQAQSKPRRWGVGVNAGYGATKDGLTPYVGVGISYSLVRW